MQRDPIEMNPLRQLQAWILDSEVQRGFALGFVLGLVFIWGP